MLITEKSILFIQRVHSLLSGAFLLSTLPLTLLAVLPAPAKTASLSSQSFDEIYVFGDSNTDVGNTTQATNGILTPPPYFEGRFSNGSVWVEYLALELGLTPNPNTNFSFIGATTGNDNAILPGAPGLQTQINGFTNALKATNQSADPNALYIVASGANDYLFGGVTDPTVPVNNLSFAVTSLTEIGAKNIMVTNLLDLGKVPATSGTSNSYALSTLSQLHKSELSATLADLSQTLAPDVNIFAVDVYSLFNEAISNPANFGFTNVTDPCLVSLNPLVVCDNPNEFLFWDQLHPTTAAHQALGEFAFSSLETEPVPEGDSRLGILAFGALGAGVLLKHKRSRSRTLVRSEI
jgi:phospholipase/lecithinase/hemolysin